MNLPNKLRIPCRLLIAVFAFGMISPVSAQRGNAMVVEDMTAMIGDCLPIGWPGEPLVVYGLPGLEVRVGQDVQKQDCLKQVRAHASAEGLYVGISLMTDYCSKPSGLDFRAQRQDGTNMVLLEVVWNDPSGVYRALRFYELWLFLPGACIEDAVEVFTHPGPFTGLPD